MSINQPVFPIYGSGQTIATSATSQSVTVPRDAKQLLITAIAQNQYVRLSNSENPSAASAVDFLIPAGNYRLISKGSQDVLSVVSPSGAGSVHVIAAEGATAA